MRLPIYLTLLLLATGCASGPGRAGSAPGEAVATRPTAAPGPGEGQEIETYVLDWVNLGPGHWVVDHTAVYMNLRGAREPFFAVRGTNPSGPGVTQEFVVGRLTAAAAKTSDTLVVSFLVDDSRNMTVEAWARSVFWLHQAIKKASVKNKVIIVAYIMGPATGTFRPPHPTTAPQSPEAPATH